MIDSDAAVPTEPQAIDASASLLMKRGIRLVAEATPESVTEAIACFDRALELRRRLPIDAVAVYRYGLAACWLNRADALVRLADAGRAADAMQSYDAGIELLLRLPLADDPRFPRRLAIAYQNRGLALQIYGRPAAEAVAAFADAIAVLDGPHSAAIPDRRSMLATVWMNLGNARLAVPAADSAAEARAAARRAVELVGGLETDDLAAAEVGLKARHVLCRGVAGLLGQPTAGGEMPDAVHDATDAVDEGLSLVRLWEQKGSTGFRGIAYDLFRFGSRVYAYYQPQFVAEFVREHTDPRLSSAAFVDSPEMRAAAADAQQLVARAST